MTPTRASGAGVARSGSEPLTVLSVMLRSADYLAEKGVESARLDAEHLLAHVLGVGRLEMYLQHERPLLEEELSRFRPMLRRRAKREPLQYILGRQAFRELELEVGPGVLIPRPETERLVEVVLAWAEKGGKLTALDVGTGSGAIALSLLTEGRFSACVGTDPSSVALDFAGRNREAAGLTAHLDLRLGWNLDPIRSDEWFDVVVSNPPYVAEVDRDALPAEVVDWEPEQALFGGRDGLDVIRQLVVGSAGALRVGGLLALEVGEGQAGAVAGLLGAAGSYDDVRVHQDLSGRDRIVTAIRARIRTGA